MLLLWVAASVSTDRPETYDDIAMHFKYGSIGSEPGGSILDPIGGALPPYWVGSLSGPMIFNCSMIEPGQPCVTISGSAS